MLVSDPSVIGIEKKNVSVSCGNYQVGLKTSGMKYNIGLNRVRIDLTILTQVFV